MVRGSLHRRLHRDARDDGPGPRRRRPVSADAEPLPTRVARFGARLARPRLGRRGRPRRRTRAASPTPRRRRCPTTLRAEIEAHMAKYPDRRSAALPRARRRAARARLVLARGDRAGRRGHAPDARRTSIAVATFYDMFDTRPVGRHRVYVCTNISCSLNGGRALYDAHRGAGRRRPGHQRARTSSASARATSRRWRRSTASTSGRSSSTRCPSSSSRSAPASRSLPAKQLPSARRSTRTPASPGRRRRRPQMPGDAPTARSRRSSRPRPARGPGADA